MYYVAPSLPLTARDGWKQDVKQKEKEVRKVVCLVAFQSAV